MFIPFNHIVQPHKDHFLSGLEKRLGQSQYVIPRELPDCRVEVKTYPLRLHTFTRAPQTPSRLTRSGCLGKQELFSEFHQDKLQLGSKVGKDEPPFKGCQVDLNQRQRTSDGVERRVSPNDFPELLSGDRQGTMRRGGTCETDFAKKPVLRVKAAKRNWCEINGKCDILATYSLIFPVRREAC